MREYIKYPFQICNTTISYWKLYQRKKKSGMWNLISIQKFDNDESFFEELSEICFSERRLKCVRKVNWRHNYIEIYIKYLMLKITKISSSNTNLEHRVMHLISFALSSKRMFNDSAQTVNGKHVSKNLNEMCKFRSFSNNIMTL